MDAAWKSESGFSLIEMLLASALTASLMAFTLSALVGFEGVNSDLKRTNDLQRRLRHAAELLKEEVGQAGTLGTFLTTLTNTAASNSYCQTTEPTTKALYVGRRVMVGSPANREVVTLETVDDYSFAAQFKSEHAAGEPVYSTGLILNGVLPTSSSNELRLVGDMRGDGTLSQVIYRCASASLTRSEAPIREPVMEPPTTVLRGLATPQSGGCFQYETEIIGGNTVIIGVRVSLTAMAEDGSLRTATLNLAPRSIQMARAMAQDGETQWLQDLPSTLPD